jgi:spermidine synthase
MVTVGAALVASPALADNARFARAGGGMTTEREERLLARVEDAFGVISVYEVDDYRFLEFGDAIEQSCVFTADPSWLEYDYTRAMLVGALCHEQPESALFLGLGAGTLTQACLKFLPLEDVEAIELRPDVPRLAMEYLGLDDDPRLYMRIGDALELLPRRRRPTCCSSTCTPTMGRGRAPGLDVPGELPEAAEPGRLAGDQPVGHR